MKEKTLSLINFWLLIIILILYMIMSALIIYTARNINTALTALYISMVILWAFLMLKN